jgi:hypothetical protein
MAEISRQDDRQPPRGDARAPGFAARLLAALPRVEPSELRVVAAFLAVCVAVRLMRLQPIESYDDEVTRWNFVRQWFYQNGFQHGPWTHHMARLGLNVPLFVVQALFGPHASAYYIWPVTSSALQVLLTYLTARRLGGSAAGVIAAILLSVVTGMDRGASQILPDACGATAMIRDSERYSYVLRDAATYGSGLIEEWVDCGCAVVLTEARNHLLAAQGVPSLIVKLNANLPTDCGPPGR